MSVINDPGLNEIGRGIISEPGFRPRDTQSLRRAWEQWTERATPRQRLAAEQVHFFEWLRGLHREWQREEDRRPGGAAVPLPAADAPGVVAGRLVEEEPAGEHVPPVSELKFRSESPEWPEPERGRPPAPPAWPPAPAGQRREPSRPVPPVRVNSLPDPGAVPAETRAAWPVPQPSRKVASYRQMFPELARPVATASGPKVLADCDGRDLTFRIAEIASHRQSLATANAGDEARIEDREKLNARDRVRIAEREQNMRDAKAAEERLARAARALEEHGVALIGELPAEALDECGFTRRVA